MDISIRQRGVPVDDVLRAEIERRISTALRPFEPRIGKVEFLLEELNLRRNDSDRPDAEKSDGGNSGNDKGGDQVERASKSDKKNGSVKTVRAEEVRAASDDGSITDPEVERVDPERKSARAERLRSGADKYCQVLIRLRRGALLKVEDTDASVTTLVARVADRVGHVVSRRFERGAADRNRREKLRVPVPELPDDVPGSAAVENANAVPVKS